MAWRVDEFLLRGEIDQRVRGRVTGRLWFMGRAEPVELDLTGNAWRDLAGRRLEFVNPTPKTGDLSQLATRQHGVIGDCTASRKVKVPDIPLDQIGEYYAAGRKWTWHWGNSLYLEWFSQENGRVVIESASYQLTIAPDATWDMTAEEEEEQRRANAAAMNEFMGRLGEATLAEATEEDLSPPPESLDPAERAETGEPGPMTEAEADRMAEENERLLDRIQARMEREGDAADFEQILHDELKRAREERGEPPPTPEESAAQEARVEEWNRAMSEAGDDADPDDEPADHPLAERAHELTVRLMREPGEFGWVPADASEEHPLVDVAAASSKASAKLAGALNGEPWPPDLEFCALILVRLKRARGYIEDAVRAVEGAVEQNLGTRAWREDVARELEAIGRECDALIAELRAKLDRGID